MARKKITATAIAIAAVALLAAFDSTPSARAADDSPHLLFNGTAVQPATLTVPANTPIKLLVTNTSAAAIEFESFELHRERVVQPDRRSRCCCRNCRPAPTRSSTISVTARSRARLSRTEAKNESRASSDRIVGRGAVRRGSTGAPGLLESPGARRLVGAVRRQRCDRAGLLRLSLEPNAMAVVQRRRARLVVDSLRSQGRTKPHEFFIMDRLHLGPRQRGSEA